MLNCCGEVPNYNWRGRTETSNNGTETARNVYGTNLLTRTVAGISYNYFYNGHADVTALVNASTGSVSATYYYDAFGVILSSTGGINNNIAYAGYQYDAESGYYYLNSRMYDPKIARFLQEDTFTGNPNDPLSLNLYTYVKNDPLMYTDPTGHYINNPKTAADCTKNIQEKLNALGFRDQNGKKLAVDGIWGPKTQYAYNNYVNSLRGPQPISSGANSEGSVNSDSNRAATKVTQEKLNALGFRDQNGQKLVVDGVWGSKTQYAYKQYENSLIGSKLNSNVSGGAGANSSSSVPWYDLEKWNNAETIKITNCYSYAFDMTYNPLTGNPFNYGGMQFGDLYYSKYPLMNLLRFLDYLKYPISGDSQGNKDLQDLLTRDADAAGIKLIPYNENLSGGYRIQIFVKPGEDFHFYRQDSNGNWSHKPGGTPLTDRVTINEFKLSDYKKDFPNAVITQFNDTLFYGAQIGRNDPSEIAKYSGYTDFVGDFYVIK